MGWLALLALVLGAGASVATFFWGKQAGFADGWNAAEDFQRIRRVEQREKLIAMAREIRNSQIEPKDPKVKAWVQRSSSF